MDVKEQIKEFIANQPEPKQSEIQELHKHILKVLPNCKLWFADGKNSENKVVAHPTIGYGSYNIKYANGTTREFFQIGMGANTAGLFVHVLPIKDKEYFAQTYRKELGKASMSGYSIKFKALKDINLDVLKAVILYGVAVNP